MKYWCLSIVSPNGSRIANGEKTIEVRSWLPNLYEGTDLLIIENAKYLKNDGDIDPEGTPVALVKIKNLRPYLESDIPVACASRWEPGYFSWELKDVRPVQASRKVVAERGIYEAEVEIVLKSKVLLVRKSSGLRTFKFLC